MAEKGTAYFMYFPGNYRWSRRSSNDGSIATRRRDGDAHRSGGAKGKAPEARSMFDAGVKVATGVRGYG